MTEYKTCANCKWYREGLTPAERNKWSWSNEGRWARGMCARFNRPESPRQVHTNCLNGWEQKDMDQLTFGEVTT